MPKALIASISLIFLLSGQSTFCAEKEPVNAENWWWNQCEAGLDGSTALDTARLGLTESDPKFVALQMAAASLEKGNARVLFILDPHDYKETEIDWRLARYLKASPDRIYLGHIAGVYHRRGKGHRSYDGKMTKSPDLMVGNKNFIELFVAELMGDKSARGHIDALQAVARDEHWISGYHLKDEPVIILLEDLENSFGAIARPGLISVNENLTQKLLELGESWSNDGLKVKFVIHSGLNYPNLSWGDLCMQVTGSHGELSAYPPNEPRFYTFGNWLDIITLPRCRRYAQFSR